MRGVQKGINDLYTWCQNNGDFGQQIIKEWVGEDEQGNKVEMDEVSRGNGRDKFKWKCSEGHEWTAVIYSRTNKKSDCPYCSRERRSKVVSKAMLNVGVNDLKTWCQNNGEFGQQLINEWIDEDENGNKVKMDEVARGSHLKVKWKCSQEHEWIARIHDRTGHKTYCPYCNSYGTSYSEKYLYYALKQLYPKTENRCRVLKSSENSQGIEFDIGIPDIPLCIEYSPTYWHNWREEQDEYKKQLCKQYNVRLIQIVEDSYDELEQKFEDDFICFKMKYSMKTETMQMILEHILKTLKHSIDEVDLNKVEEDTQKALENKGVQQGVNDLETWCKNNGEFGQKLIKEWTGYDTQGNKISMGNITRASNKKVKWKCIKGHEWIVSIGNRTSNKLGCPYCLGKKASPENSLLTWCQNHGEYGQKLIEKWIGLDEDNKPISMDEITYSSHKRVQWRNKDSSIRYSTINSRTNGR